jgi:hypothetical protein
MAWLQSIPLALAGALFLVVLLIAVEAGYRGERWLHRREEDRSKTGQDYLLSAVLGLLALLLGFTFSLALNRYEARRDLVVQEANAIGTTWLRVQLLQAPDRGRMSGLLRAYADARIAWSEADAGPRALEPTSALQSQLWDATGAMVRAEPSQVLARGVMETMNDSFDLAAARYAARTARIPDQVLTVLALYSVLSMVMLGYILGYGGHPHRIATTLLLVLLTLALVMILDLDRPRTGAIQVSQQPLMDLRASMR